MLRINRRDFLKFTAVSGCTILTGAPKELMAQEHFSGWPDRFGVLMDLTLCIGRNCRKCEFACNEVNQFPPPKVPSEDNSVFDIHRRPDAHNFTVVNRFPNPKPGGDPIYIKKQCMHCNEPSCASACLVGALRKTREGAVIYNKDICLGCRYCMTACPFYIPAYDYFNAFTPEVRKCTLCYPRIIKREIPACARICPKEALTFAKRSDLIQLARTKISRQPEKYINHIYGEDEAGGTSWMYIAGVPFEQLGFPVNIGITPFPEFTRGFLSAVPLVLVMWPPFLGGLYAFTKNREQGAGSEGADTQKEDHNPQEYKVTEEASHSVETKEDLATTNTKPAPRKNLLSLRSWIMDKLFMGMSVTEYARSLVTPFNIVAALILLVGLPVIGLRFSQGLGAVTNASDDYPWGLFLGYGLFSGVPLSAGGFILAMTVYLFGLRQYHSLLRLAILTGFLGYFFAVVFLLVDLGRPWRLPYPMFVAYGTASVLFLVAWHVALYLSVQFVEFCPAIFEWLDFKTLRRWAARLTIGATIFGVILSTLHQSALGAMFLLMPGKLHPLWYSPFIPVFFFVSSIAAGISVVIAASALCSRFLTHRADHHFTKTLDELTLGLGKAASIVLITYFSLKLIGVAHGNHWNLLISSWGFWFLIEIFAFVLLPCFLYASGVRDNKVGLVRFTSFLTVIGILFNRLTVSLIAFNWNLPHREIPHWKEFIILATIATISILTFRWIVNRMPVLRQHPQYVA